MGHEEIREVKKTVLLEFVEAQEELAAIEARLSRVGEAYEQLGHALRRAPLSAASLHCFRLAAAADSAPAALPALLEALQAAAAKRDRLAERKKALNLP